MKKKMAKLRKELRALRKGVEKISKDALSCKEAHREVRPQEEWETQGLPDP